MHADVDIAPAFPLLRRDKAPRPYIKLSRFCATFKFVSGHPRKSSDAELLLRIMARSRTIAFIFLIFLWLPCGVDSAIVSVQFGAWRGGQPRQAPYLSCLSAPKAGATKSPGSVKSVPGEIFLRDYRRLKKCHLFLLLLLPVLLFPPV